MRAKAYTSYKPSGVKGLGEVPEHWDVKRLKSVATYKVSNVDKIAADHEKPVRLCNYTDVYYHDHITPDMELMETTATPQEIRSFGLHVGDVIITKDSEDWSDIAVPALVVGSAPNLVCGYHLAIVRPRTCMIAGEFLLRAFQACAVNQQFRVAATGVTRYGLPKPSIGEAWLPLAPIDEQRDIVSFLDRRMAKIDTLVAKKRVLIERLTEKRAALISRTVTRGLPPAAARQAGLDPHPKLKPSGIDWLGDVPEHWQTMMLKRTWKTCDYGVSDSLSGDGPVRVLTMSHIRDGRVLIPDNGCLDEVREDMRVRNGDLLFNRTNSLIHVAKVGLFDTTTDEPITFASYLVRIRTNSQALPSFMNYLLNTPAVLGVARSLALPSINQANLNPTRYGQVLVAMPTIMEQHAITDFLDQETAKIEALITKVETAIERLREYRTALITAAVTGKIDVREAVE